MGELGKERSAKEKVHLIILVFQFVDFFCQYHTIVIILTGSVTAEKVKFVRKKHRRHVQTSNHSSQGSA